VYWTKAAKAAKADSSDAAAGDRPPRHKAAKTNKSGTGTNAAADAAATE